MAAALTDVMVKFEGSEAFREVRSKKAFEPIINSKETHSMNTSMKDKLALITGGTSGIGRATAVAFANRGANIVVTGRREAEGKEPVDLVKRAGDRAAFFRADVSKPGDAKAMSRSHHHNLRPHGLRLQ